MAVRTKASHLPQIKKKLIEEQGGVCPLCKRDLRKADSYNQCVDHDHETGLIRAVLCRQCNGAEGKIKNLAIRCVTKLKYKEFLISLAAYLQYHEEPRTNYIHHTFICDSF